MRSLTKVEKYRVEGEAGDHNGQFRVPLKNDLGVKVQALVQISDGLGWEHASVSMIVNPRRNPSWLEMCQVKSLFFRDDERVVQYHPPEGEYVSTHDYCLHLWRPLLDSDRLPFPPSWMVGMRPGQSNEEVVAEYMQTWRQHNPGQDEKTERVEENIIRHQMRLPLRRPPPETVCVGHNCPTNKEPNYYTGPACCERAGEYNGYGSDGPRLFTCPKGCSCHD